MYDREIVMDSLQKISKAIETILERAAVVTDPNDLLCSPGGMMRLDAICMNLIACLNTRRLAMPEKRTKFESALLLCPAVKKI